MTHHDRLRIDLAAAAYLEALTRDDVETQARLWGHAAGDPNLLTAFQEVHDGLLEENEAVDHTATGEAIAEAAETHFTSAEVVRPPTGTVTVGDVANELFYHTPDRLSPEAHALNAALRASSEPLPADLGIWALREWAEGKFGVAPAEYWRAFGEAARKVRMRANSDAEYQLAARRAKPSTGGAK